MTNKIKKVSLFFPFLTLLVFIVLLKVKPVFAETPISCEFHMFAVDANYKLPYKYDTAEIANSSTISADSYFVYSFVIKSDSNERKNLTKATFQQVSGNKEPIEILAVRPQNGSCDIDQESKLVACNLSYSFTESAHYPIEYLVKIKSDPQKTTTSSLFSVTTDFGGAQCANWLKIKPKQNVINPVKWETPFASLISSDFFIRIGSQKFYGKEPIYLHSDPGVDKTTLEVIWNENGVEMRMFLYFQKIENNTWELYEVRSYNGQSQGDWIYYKESLGNKISSLIGQHNYADSRIFVPINGQDAEISCKKCDINAFMPLKVSPVPGNYSLTPLIGLPNGEIITLSTDPKYGYGVNVILRDSQNQTVVTQGGFNYQWSADDPQIVNLTPGALDYGNNTCAYDINPPCPYSHVDLKGLLPGKTIIRVKVMRKNDNATIAETSFQVKVVEAIKLEKIEDVASTGKISAEQEDLIKVKRDLDRMAQELEVQKKEVGRLGGVVESIRQFLEKIFGRFFH